MISELKQFHAEASKRAIISSTKESGFLLCSFQSTGDSSAQTINYSETPVNSYVRALWQNGNYGEVLEYSAFESNYDSVLLYFHIKSLLKLNSKKLDNVLEIIAKNDKFSSDPFINYCKAQICFEKEDFSLALSESVKVIQNCPFFWDAWLLLIASVRHEEQINTAIELIKTSNSLMSLNAALHLHAKIRNSVSRNMFLSLESTFKTEDIMNNIYLKSIQIKYYIIECNGIERLPNLAQSYFAQMSDIYSDFLYLNSKADDLKNFAKYLVEIRGWTRECCYVIGNMYSLLRQHEKSILWLKRALIIDSRYESALIVLGNEYIDIKAPNDAIAAYSTALKLNPLNYRTYFSLGLVYYLLDDLDRAVYFLKTAINIEPNDYRPFELLSECYQNLGFPEHAIEYLNSANKCSDSPHSLIKKLALLYREIGDSKNYLKFYVKFFELCLSKDRKDYISDDSDLEAATMICKNNQSPAMLDCLKKSIMCYNKQI